MYMKEKAPQSPIIYVVRDIERALGMTPTTDYIIVANKSPHAEEIQKKYPDFVFLAEGNIPLDTYDILLIPDVEALIETKKADILVFKNTKRIEELCAKKKWTLLNPSATLAETIENKISQVKWLSEDASMLPLHAIGTMSEISKKIYPETGRAGKNTAGIFADEPFILQWAHSHTGEGTTLIAGGDKGKKDFDLILSKFPARDVRVTRFIHGPVFTANVCVSAKNTHIGNISYQITGMLPFTENPFSTVGNDWSLPHTILDEGHLDTFNSIAIKMADRMRAAGWKGLFGIDCIYDSERNQLHLIEINARQPASTTYESQLQTKLREHGIKGMTTFEAHIAALLAEKKENKIKKSAENKIIEINDGAQIIERVTLFSEKKSKDDVAATIEALQARSYTVIAYDNTKINSDLLRIQSLRGIMETHNKFNSRGKEILAIISGVPETEIE